ncbi:unnamed protein product [Parnassius mnemosyne]|uniref:Uncharacterized protein n=1 Tax=Parnassius mnemosyne TaxID=213953 RepID=A0AAV1LY65_9NEOP
MAGSDGFKDATDSKVDQDATNLDALSKLQHARGQCKRTITMVENFKQGATDPSAAALQLRLRAIDNAYNNFTKLQADIAAIQGFMDHDEGFEERYFNLNASFSTVLECVRADDDDTKTSRGSRCGTTLPPIDITDFSGGIGQYRPFIDLFSTVTSSNRNPSNIQRLFYLRMYLKGEALALIDNLPLINYSYTHAFELLNNRYDNKALIVNNHINTLLDLPVIKSSAQQLRSLVSQVSQQVTALQNLGQAMQWDTILVCILTRKLDTSNLQPLPFRTQFRFHDYFKRVA